MQGFRFHQRSTLVGGLRGLVHLQIAVVTYIVVWAVGMAYKAIIAGVALIANLSISGVSPDLSDSRPSAWLPLFSRRAACRSRIS